jgi:hypothetical protein
MHHFDAEAGASPVLKKKTIEEDILIPNNSAAICLSPILLQWRFPIMFRSNI